MVWSESIPRIKEEKLSNGNVIQTVYTQYGYYSKVYGAIVKTNGDVISSLEPLPGAKIYLLGTPNTGSGLPIFVEEPMKYVSNSVCDSSLENEVSYLDQDVVYNGSTFVVFCSAVRFIEKDISTGVNKKSVPQGVVCRFVSEDGAVHCDTNWGTNGKAFYFNQEKYFSNGPPITIEISNGQFGEQVSVSTEAGNNNKMFIIWADKYNARLYGREVAMYGDPYNGLTTYMGVIREISKTAKTMGDTFSLSKYNTDVASIGPGKYICVWHDKFNPKTISGTIPSLLKRIIDISSSISIAWDPLSDLLYYDLKGVHKDGNYNPKVACDLSNYIALWNIADLPSNSTMNHYRILLEYHSENGNIVGAFLINPIDADAMDADLCMGDIGDNQGLLVYVYQDKKQKSPKRIYARFIGSSCPIVLF